jgi:hypothetical protein
MFLASGLLCVKNARHDGLFDYLSYVMSRKKGYSVIFAVVATLEQLEGHAFCSRHSWSEKVRRETLCGHVNMKMSDMHVIYIITRKEGTDTT